MKTENNRFADDALISSLPGFENYYHEVNQVKLHFVKGGKGEPLVLLPGWPETWWAYHKVMPKLAEDFTVIVIDVRGMGTSDKPADGYDKKSMARDIYELITQLGFDQVNIGGHDIGAMVAFSFAVNYPDTTRKLILIDAMHPEESMYSFTILPTFGTLGDGKKADRSSPFPWWFAFHQVPELPEKLLLGRVKLEHDWFFSYMLSEDHHIDDFSRSVYNLAYESPDGIRAGNEWFRAFGKDIEDNKGYPKLSVPVLGIGGASHDWMGAVLPSKVENLKLVKAEKSGHFPIEEEPDLTVKYIKDFLKD